MSEPTPSRLEYFWRHVDIDASTGCWNWTASLDIGGYGRFSDNRKGVKAHRWSYTYHVGPIPEGLVIDHLCRNRRCCNPEHLEPVTQAENLNRGNRKRPKARHSHCKRGHEFTPDNIVIQPNGDRTCRTCRLLRERARGRDWAAIYISRKAGRIEKQRQAELKAFVIAELKREVSA